jgi:hypothetical protein
MTRLDEAWQGALAAEQRAAFGYGLLGAHLHGSARLPLAISCSNAHEQLRDRTAEAIAAAGLTPVAPAADYPDLYPVTSSAQAVALAPKLEDDCAAAWRYLYAAAASTPGSAARALRAPAQTALTASAVRAVRWRKVSDPSAAAVAFPGV